MLLLKHVSDDFHADIPMVHFLHFPDIEAFFHIK